MRPWKRARASLAHLLETSRCFSWLILALYFEVVVIRYLSTEMRVFAYFKNLPLISSFLGLDLGVAMGSPTKVLRRLFPLIAASLFLLMAFAPAHI